jgi:chemotaxis methyl-accepting protein methylase
VSDRAFDDFLREACPPLGLEWRRFRRRAPRLRVAERMRALGLTSYADYLARLREDPAEAAALGNRMHVTITRFFRERERWEGLIAHVLPVLAARLAPGEPLRAWSAGCCGGEEPASLVLAWRAACGEAAPLEVVATDIDAAALARARAGLYREGALREVPGALRAAAFTPAGPGGLWRLRPEVQAPLHLALADLLADVPPPPGSRHLVLCSYLAFTYFTGARRAAALGRLTEALAPGGALVIGGQERLTEAEQERLAPWPHAPCTFRRIN